MEKLLKYLVSNIVENTDDLKISSKEENGIEVFQLKVAESDMARVIGKKGRIINSLRRLIRIKSYLLGKKTILQLEE